MSTKNSELVVIKEFTSIVLKVFNRALQSNDRAMGTHNTAGEAES